MINAGDMNNRIYTSQEEAIKRVVSISGGKSSAYVAANYPADRYVFALVTTLDRACLYPDPKIRQEVSDRIGREFIGTLEDDIIIHTILDLEQYLGKSIEFVVGKPFEQLRKNSVPNIMWRFCTTSMKIKPIFDWWKDNFDSPVDMLIGFRSGEERRAKKMLESCNENGLREYNKTGWEKPLFPMIQDGIRRDQVSNFWADKRVRFAHMNNCVGCFHRNPLVLRKMFELHPEKMEVFIKEEERKNSRFKSEVSYSQIKRHKPQNEINFEEWGCDSGYCGL